MCVHACVCVSVHACGKIILKTESAPIHAIDFTWAVSIIQLSVHVTETFPNTVSSGVIFF